ncbi:DUF3800 domain-containing protein [Pseudomonas aeruginosa]|uniref:DUF3800 domain-containing protein n=1 Tax=Pseudomonas aeruginosa TaxID=287 RepID=UPI003981B116
MVSSLAAYIDESGNEGFTFREDGGGSSRWFVLSAQVVRKPNDVTLVAATKHTRERIRLEPKKPVHFCKLKHEQRTPVARAVDELSVRTVSDLSTSLPLSSCERLPAERPHGPELTYATPPQPNLSTLITCRSDSLAAGSVTTKPDALPRNGGQKILFMSPTCMLDGLLSARCENPSRGGFRSRS